jgi:hypothetical protein
MGLLVHFKKPMRFGQVFHMLNPHTKAPPEIAPEWANPFFGMNINLIRKHREIEAKNQRKNKIIVENFF